MQEPRECPMTDTPPWKVGFRCRNSSSIRFISEATWFMMVCDCVCVHVCGIITDYAIVLDSGLFIYSRLLV